MYIMSDLRNAKCTSLKRIELCNKDKTNISALFYFITMSRRFYAFYLLLNNTNEYSSKLLLNVHVAGNKYY